MLQFEMKSEAEVCTDLLQLGWGLGLGTGMSPK